MISIELNETSVEDFRAIQELKQYGFSDQQIQKWYDDLQFRRRENNDE